MKSSTHIIYKKGTLVKCDASIKAMLMDIDSKNGNEFIIEDLDEEHVLVKETKIATLKAKLQQVRTDVSDVFFTANSV